MPQKLFSKSCRVRLELKARCPDEGSREMGVSGPVMVVMA